MEQKTKITAWNMDEASNDDPQLDDMQRTRNLKSAQAQMADAMVRDAQANQDFKIEGEQLGKDPWERWYSGSQAQTGYSSSKGVADWLFLSIFGHSSATDKKRSRLQRAIIRVILTAIIIFIGNLLYQLMLSGANTNGHGLFH